MQDVEYIKTFSITLHFVCRSWGHDITPALVISFYDS